MAVTKICPPVLLGGLQNLTHFVSSNPPRKHNQRQLYIPNTTHFMQYTTPPNPPTTTLYSANKQLPTCFYTASDLALLPARGCLVSDLMPCVPSTSWKLHKAQQKVLQLMFSPAAFLELSKPGAVLGLIFTMPKAYRYTSDRIISSISTNAPESSIQANEPVRYHRNHSIQRRDQRTNPVDIKN